MWPGLALINVQFWTATSVVSPFGLLSNHKCLVESTHSVANVTQEVSRQGASQVLATVLEALLQAWQLFLQLCSVPPRMCAASLLGHNWLAMLPLQKPLGSCATLSTPVLHAVWQQLISWCHLASNMFACMLDMALLAGATQHAHYFVKVFRCSVCAIHCDISVCKH